jgi:hypothetical protein
MHESFTVQICMVSEWQNGLIIAISNTAISNFFFDYSVKLLAARF